MPPSKFITNTSHRSTRSSELTKAKPLRFECTGSSYEGVKVSKGCEDHDFEYDVMVIMEGGSELEIESIPDRPGDLKLKEKIAEKVDLQQDRTLFY